MMFIILPAVVPQMPTLNPFRSAQACLAHSISAQRVKSEIDRQRALLARIRSCLPVALAERCTSSVLNGDVLSLHTESPVWASRLRYMQVELARSLAQEGMNIREIRVRINVPGGSASPQSQRSSQGLSAENAKLLQSVAEATTDPDLKRALQRLSAHTK